MKALAARQEEARKEGGLKSGKTPAEINMGSFTPGLTGAGLSPGLFTPGLGFPSTTPAANNLEEKKKASHLERAHKAVLSLCHRSAAWEMKYKTRGLL